MSLENRTVRLYAVNDTGFDYCSMEVTIGELTSACRDHKCPMGMFGCPVSRAVACEDVTAETWAKVLHWEDGDAQD